MSNSEKGPLLSPILRWFMFAMVLANIALFTIIPIWLKFKVPERRGSQEEFAFSATD